MVATIGVRNGRAAVLAPFFDALCEIVNAVGTNIMLFCSVHDRTIRFTPFAIYSAAVMFMSIA